MAVLHDALSRWTILERVSFGANRQMFKRVTAFCQTLDARHVRPFDGSVCAIFAYDMSMTGMCRRSAL